MATAFSNTSASSNLCLHRFRQNLFLLSPSSFSPSSRLYPHTLFLAATPDRVRRIAVAPLGPPTPPSPDPPPPKNTNELTSSCFLLTPIKLLSFNSEFEFSLLLILDFNNSNSMKLHLQNSNLGIRWFNCNHLLLVVIRRYRDHWGLCLKF